MQGLPANYVNAGASLLHGGFAPGDMVFALRDIVVQTETESGTSAAVGCGDVGRLGRKRQRCQVVGRVVGHVPLEAWSLARRSLKRHDKKASDAQRQCHPVSSRVILVCPVVA